MKDDLVYIKHIQEAIEKIQGYIADLDYEAFAQDEKTLDAVVRNLGIIGEAANNLSKEFENNNPDIPYHKMIGMRNFVIHEYFGVNEEIVWSTCREDLPVLQKSLSKF
jgi:uncharacterized protein with HEPN domain